MGPAHGFLAARVAHDGGGTHLGTAFDEHLGGHLKRFAEFHTGGEDAALLGGSDVHDIDAAELAGLVCFDGRCGGFDSQAFQRCCGACRFGADSLALGCGLFRAEVAFDFVFVVLLSVLLVRVVARCCTAAIRPYSKGF